MTKWTFSTSESPVQEAWSPSSFWVAAYYAGWFRDRRPGPAAAADMTAMTRSVFGGYAPGNAGALLEGAGTGHQADAEGGLINLGSRK